VRYFLICSCLVSLRWFGVFIVDNNQKSKYNKGLRTWRSYWRSIAHKYFTYCQSSFLWQLIRLINIISQGMTSKRSEIYLYFQNKAQYFHNMDSAMPKSRCQFFVLLRCTLDLSQDIINRDIYFTIKTKSSYRTRIWPIASYLKELLIDKARKWECCIWVGREMLTFWGAALQPLKKNGQFDQSTMRGSQPPNWKGIESN
jgi:hypothetical protein